jgi:pyrimidine-nucleoside phosphorylase
MDIIALIARKRDGEVLTTDQINWFVQAYTADAIPDYQVAALLMAIYLRGMNRQETVDLTLAMARSGDQLDLHDIVPFSVDKHSSGGVGDKTSLVVLPIVAACGLPVAKMSGRGLGSSGGTLDKMESFPGWSPDLTRAQFRRQVQEIGLVLAGQTHDLAPADGKLYALRDVTGTVACAPLIAASIMSKKLAGGADAIVLDVKAGNGAFMSSVAAARELAQTMVNIGRDADRETVALLADMNQPLGQAVGNALEVKEALDCLQGGGPADFWAHCQEVATYMLHLGQKAGSVDEGREVATAARNNGRALEKFRQLVAAQGGDPALVDQPEKLPQARLVETITASRSGYLAGVQTEAVGWTAVHLGAGRRVKGDTIDPAVGLLLPIKVGDYRHAGEPVATIHANDPDKLDRAKEELLATLTWSETPVEPLTHFYGVVT